MKKILALAGSNNSKSINNKLVKYLSTLFNKAEVKHLDLIKLDAPIYSPDVQHEKGFPETIKQLMEEIKKSDGFIIATPEHNGMITAFFKNLIDWLSRIDRKFFEGKPVLLLSTSPGKGGGKRALANLETLVGYFDADIVGRFAFPSFNENFDSEQNKVTNDELLVELKTKLEILEKKLSQIFAEN